MRAMRKPLPLAAAALAAAAIAAPGASASPIAVTDPYDDPCPALSFSGDTVSGGCEAHLVSTSEIKFGLYYAPYNQRYENDRCAMEATLWMDGDGNAAITDVSLTACQYWQPPGPRVFTCADGEAHSEAPNEGELPWRTAEPAFESAGGEVSMPMAVCFQLASSWFWPYPSDCEGLTTFKIATGTTPYAVSKNTEDIGDNFLPCYMSGTWELEGEPFTITHLEE